MSAQALPSTTVEEYLEADRAAEFKSEYYHGQMYAMSGGTVVHSLIIGNLTTQLHHALEKRRCIVCPTEIRVRVAPGGLYTYPDIVVICGDPELADGHNDTVLNPTLIVEVLSKSTEAHDRGFKFAQYRKLESLQEYVLVAQNEPRVEIFRRQPAGQWVLSEYVGLEAVCHCESLECRIPLAAIYEKVPPGADDTFPVH